MSDTTKSTEHAELFDEIFKGKCRQARGLAKCWSLQVVTVVLFTVVCLLSGIILSVSLISYNASKMAEYLSRIKNVRNSLLVMEIEKVFHTGPEFASMIVEQLEYSDKVLDEPLYHIPDHLPEFYGLFHSIASSHADVVDTLYFYEFSDLPNDDNLFVLDQSVEPSVVAIGINQTLYINFVEDAWSYDTSLNITREYCCPTGPGSRLPWFQSVVDDNTARILWGGFSKYQKVEEGEYFLSIICLKGYFRDGELAGVMDVAISLDSVGSAINSLDLSDDETVFVMLEDFTFIAGNVPDMNNFEDPISAQEHTDDMISAVAGYLEEAVDFGTLNYMLLSAKVARKRLRIEVFLTNVHDLNIVVVNFVEKKKYERVILINILASCVITISLLACCVVVGIIFSWVFMTPFEKLKKELRKISRLSFAHDDEEFLTRPPVLQAHFYEFVQLSKWLHRVKLALQLIERFVPLSVVRMVYLRRQYTFLEKKKVTIMFIDLRGFTSMTEKLEGSQTLVDFLSDFFSGVSACVKRFHGTVDKFIGDEVMAFWNAPNKTPNHEVCALECYFEILKKFDSLSGKWVDQGLKFLTTCAINTAECSVGLFGSLERINYSLLGDGVNVCKRLQSQCKEYNVDVLVGPDTFKAANAVYVFNWVDRLCLKGKEKMVDVYVPIGARSDLKETPALKIEKLHLKAREKFVDEDYEALAGISKQIGEAGGDTKMFSPMKRKSIAMLEDNCI